MWDDTSVLPAAFWPGRASPHSGSARPEKRRWAPSFPSFLRALPGLSGLLLYLPTSFLASCHDRLFLESFIHSHCFHNCPGTWVPGSPPLRSLMGQDYISSCFPDVSPETSSDTHKSQAQVVIMPPPNLLLLRRSRAPQDRNLEQRWATPPSLHTQQPNGRWVPESLHLKQVSSSALSIPTGTAIGQLPCPAPMAC